MESLTVCWFKCSLNLASFDMMHIDI